MWVYKHFFQSKMVLDIFKGVEDAEKIEEEKQEADLKEDAKQPQQVDYMKQPGRPVTMIMAIRDPGLTNQKLNDVIIKGRSLY